MAMSTRTLQTFEQFEQFQDDGMKHELLKGEHIALPPAKLRHALIQEHFVESLRPYVRRHRMGRVHSEVGYKLTSNTWLQPDVSFVRTPQIRATDPEDYYHGAPALAVEIASESNTAAQPALKMELYFAHGSEEVWVVYPKTRKIRVHYPDGNSKTVSGTELRSELFPDWSIAVDLLFED